VVGGAGTDAIKKSLRAAEQDRPHVKAQRQAWLDTLTAACDGDFTRVSFLDESGAVTSLARTYGRSDCGDRCVTRRRRDTGR
jgi:hypothetical protein